MKPHEKLVAGLFDGMAEEYDRLEDESYPHFFRQVDKMLRLHAGSGEGKRALDVGCGTGLQTLTLAALGYRATGVDISAGLLEQAKRKALERGLAIEWAAASATALPFAPGAFDLVSSCGSVLGFVPDYEKALSEMTRVLATGGKLFLEIDHRWNLDLLWGLADIVAGGRLGYEQTAAEAWRNISAPWRGGITQDYPFTKLDGTVETMSVRLFALPELLSACRARGLEPIGKWGVHSVTNLLPSTWLAHPRLSGPLRKIARGLTRLDETVGGSFPFTSCANNLILVFRKLT